MGFCVLSSQLVPWDSSLLFINKQARHLPPILKAQGQGCNWTFLNGLKYLLSLFPPRRSLSAPIESYTKFGYVSAIGVQIWQNLTIIWNAYSCFPEARASMVPKLPLDQAVSLFLRWLKAQVFPSFLGNFVCFIGSYNPFLPGNLRVGLWFVWKSLWFYWKPWANVPREETYRMESISYRSTRYQYIVSLTVYSLRSLQLKPAR